MIFKKSKLSQFKKEFFFTFEVRKQCITRNERSNKHFQRFGRKLNSSWLFQIVQNGSSISAPKLSTLLEIRKKNWIYWKLRPKCIEVVSKQLSGPSSIKAMVSLWGQFYFILIPSTSKREPFSFRETERCNSKFLVKSS